jgi:integrase
VKTANPTPEAESDDKTWQRAGENLIRYKPSGKYYARVRVRGKLILRSLKTNRVTVARLRLGDLVKQERQKAEHLAADAAAAGKLTFGNALAIYRKRLDGDLSLKPRTKTYYEERIAALLKSWPGLEKLDVSRISKAACMDWAAGYAKKASSTNYNNTIGLLKQIIEIAVEAGARYDNPAKFLKRVPVRFKVPSLPSPEQFEKMLGFVKHDGVADFIRFLAYGGFRKSEAAKILWGDVELEKERILVRGDEVNGTKNGEVRYVPMIPPMKALIEKLQAAHPHRKLSDRVAKVKECRGSLATACDKAGIPRLHHHALRHLFATRFVEAGVNLPVVSKVLGHKDGGVLLARRYNHVTDEHVAAQARRVTFGAPAGTSPQPQSSSAAGVAGAPENVVALPSQAAA